MNYRIIAKILGWIFSLQGIFMLPPCLVGIIYKDYFDAHNQVCYENPSPGNHDGGITTLEEKSLGCVQKGGGSVVRDVLDYGDTIKANGLSLLNGPGNDIVAITNLTACGVHMILFTTGRGTPLGAPVPTIKVATNNALATKKSSWIDFDASPTLCGKDLDKEFFEYVMAVAGGKETKNEEKNYREISIFKEFRVEIQTSQLTITKLCNEW